MYFLAECPPSGKKDGHSVDSGWSVKRGARCKDAYDDDFRPKVAQPAFMIVPHPVNILEKSMLKVMPAEATGNPLASSSKP